MSEVKVSRWRRYGHDRLYISLADGTRVGWHDLRTGEATLESPEHGDAFEAAISRHLQQVADPGRGQTTTPLDGSAPPRSSNGGASTLDPHNDPDSYNVRLEWRDLATNRAGQAAREQADDHRRAAPVKTAVARLLGVHTDERAWRVGANGEVKVAARLARLPDPWTTLHALPVGTRGADIDHLVIGPGGVFTLNAKHHPDATVWVGGDAFFVNGHRQPYVRNARHEARRAARLLSAATGRTVAVTGVIAVVGAAQGFTVKSQPQDVYVVARKRVHRWLGSLPTVLTDHEVTTIVDAARRSDTWQPQLE